jgi:hypothetical protein
MNNDSRFVSIRLKYLAAAKFAPYLFALIISSNFYGCRTSNSNSQEKEIDDIVSMQKQSEDEIKAGIAELGRYI